MKKIYILFLLAAFSVQLKAGKIERAYEALEVFNYFKAKELFDKVKDKDIVAAPFGLSVIYGRNDNPFYNLDSAFHYILQADSNYLKLVPKGIEDLHELDVDSMRIENWKDSIDRKVFEKIAANPSVSLWETYINKHFDSPYLQQAIEARDQLAFAFAKEKNTADAYQFFIQTYPNSKQYYEAKNLFELRLYEEQTSHETVVEYQQFVLTYPNSPYLRTAQDSIYNKVTKANRIEVYERFIEGYPDNPNVEKAWKNLYKLYMVDYSPERIVEFRIDYPDFPFVADLMQDMKLALKTYLPFSRNGKWGFMDTTGQILIAPEYDLVEPFQEGLALAVKDGKVGYLNKSGEVVIPFEYEDGESFKQGLAVVMKQNYYGLIDKTNQARLPFTYEVVGTFYSDLAVIANDTAYGYVNREGKVVIPPTLEFADDFQHGFAMVELDEKKGLINELGKLVVPAEYQWLENLNELGLARAKKDSLYGLIDKNGSVVLPFEYDRIGEFQEGLALIMKQGKYGYVNSQGEIVIDLDFDFKVEALVWGKFHESYVKYHLKEKFGILDTSGAKVFPAIFQDVGEYKPNTFVAVKKRGKWGYSNENLNLVIPYQYEVSRTFENERGLVKKEGRWGMINKKENWVLENRYAQIENLGDSLYLLKHEEGQKLFHLSNDKPFQEQYLQIKVFNQRYLSLQTENSLMYYDRERKNYIQAQKK
ncbi:MAG: WG repeat-containing protein [Vicingaceae bacterium]